METLRRARRPVRRQFDAYHRELEALLKEPSLKEDIIKVKFKLFTKTCDKLLVHDGKILEQLVVDNLPEAEENKEYDEIKDYQEKAETLRNNKVKLLPTVKSHGSVAGGSNSSEGKVRKFKLPKIEMRKFSGDIKDWLGFWGQFKKIDEDPEMDGSDKFCYLLQCLEPGTDTYDSATIYPPSNENYVKVIEALKKEFANEDLQLQVYLRELLSLVINNVKSKEKIPMKTLFLKLDSHLRALHTLNLKEADPATWLFPLVESCLPESVQYTWQRSSLCKHDGSKDDPPRSRLDLLMAFVESEVEIKQRIDIARSFAEQHREAKTEPRNTKSTFKDKRSEMKTEKRSDRRASLPTLTSFHAADERKCVFCERTNHRPEDCFKARNMTHEEKMTILKEKALCFRCCGHHIGRNCHAKNLDCRVCKGKHFTVLCRDFKLGTDGNARPPPRKRPRVESETTTQATTTTCANLECSGEVALQTLKVKLVNGDKELVVRAFLDSGSQRSYILKSTARELKLKSYGTEKVLHSLFGGKTHGTVTHHKYNVMVRSLDGSFQTRMELRDNDTICGTIPSVRKFQGTLDMLRKQNVYLSDAGNHSSEIELMIGADIYARLCTGQLLEFERGPVALKTKLGWTLMGPVTNSESTNSQAITRLVMTVSDNTNTINTMTNSESTNSQAITRLAMAVSDNTNTINTMTNSESTNSQAITRLAMAVSDNTNTMSTMTISHEIPCELANSDSMDSMAITRLAMSVSDICLRNLWELDILGIQGPDAYATKETQEHEAKVKFLKTITRQEDGRYIVELPWKVGHDVLPTNRPVAYKRLQASSRKLAEAKLFDAYDSIFKDWKKEGFIEEVPIIDYDNDCHYLPHRPVIKQTSLTTPVRPVFDASCRVGKSPSLNDCLVKGDNLIQRIPDLIQRFREHKVGFVSDIRKAFQMIAVHLKDRDHMRFLWWKDSEMKEQVEYRHARVMFGATCSPYILAAVLEHHLTALPEEEKELGCKLLNTLYVDNCVSSEPSNSDYQSFRARSVEVMERACMDLRMWLSNVEDTEDEVTRIISVLGLQWDRKTDELFVNMKQLTTPEKVTKRNVLSTIQKIFDPVGFTCPAVLPMKILLQKTWINKMKWDDILPEGEGRLFLDWLGEVNELGNIHIPRMSTDGKVDRSGWSLHTFSDASKEAYAAAVFLKTEEEGNVKVQLLSAKSRVAPVKALSIPKLELLGCWIAVLLTSSVKVALNMDGVPETFWSDSSTALAWIRRNDQWGTFVANRTKFIRRMTQVGCWRHVPGIMNPADLPSRGIYPAALRTSKWWEGPQWLYEPSDTWPKEEEEVDEEEVSRERTKSKNPAEVFSFAVIDHVRAQHPFRVLIRIVGWVRRFLFNYLKRGVGKRSGLLSGSELQEAEKVLIKGIQTEAFPKDERNQLKGLELIEDEWGILRVKSRLTYRNDPFNFKFPYLLPSQRWEVKQLISDTHRSYCHAGAGFLTMKLRQKYWILKSRKTIKSVITKCYKCRRFSAKPTIPDAAPLPLDRVKNAEAFEVVGVDLAGPLVLKNGNKTWLVIITCAVYRAVHFEVVKSCNTRAFITALGRFVKRYRRPAIIYCDNGTNFHGADNLFKRLDWDVIMQDEGASRIEFKFNPVTAAWWGGWWERLIRTAKDLLKRTVGKGSLNGRELEDIVESIAEVMNGRPLTYVSDDPEDLEPLTPSHFIHPLGSIQFPEENRTESQELRFRHAYVNSLKKELKNRFLKEYLAYLVNRNPKKATRELGEGELVLVGNDQKKRLYWPLGRIIKILPGGDGVSRLANVKTQNGDIVRAMQRLYALEVDAQDPLEETVREKGTVTRSGRRVKVPIRFK